MQPEVERFRVVRHKTLSILDEVSDRQASWSPRRGSWSIAQIADHLLGTEVMYREQFQRLLDTAAEGGTSVEIGLREVDVAFAAIPREVMPLLEMPFRMFNQFVPAGVRETIIRYPIVSSLNPRQSQPRDEIVLADLKGELAAAFAATEEFFRAPMPPNLDRITINHPILGSNTIPQLFRIVIAHEQRHHEQMARVRSNPSFPRQ